MKKFFLSVILACAAFSSWGQANPLDGLTQAQKDKIAAIIAEEKKPTAVAKSMSETVRGEAGAWSDLIMNTMTNAASKANMVVTDFLDTPAGKITAAIVIYKVIGKEAIRVFAGAMTWIVGIFFSLGLWRHRERYVSRPQSYDYKPYLFGMWQRKVVTETRTQLEGGDTYTVFALCAAVATTFLSLMVAFA